MIDRRFLNIGLTVLGVANAPEANPTAGTQYIIGNNPTGAFEGKTVNSLARYDGTKWDFTPPKSGGFEIFNASTGELLQYNGSIWTPIATLGGGDSVIAPVLDIIQSGTTLPQTASIGDKFLDTETADIYTATAENTWNSGSATASGARYASTTDHKIYQSNGTRVEPQNLPVGELFLNIADGFTYAYNGTDIVQVDTPNKIITEFHTLTAEDIINKSFALEKSLKLGQELNTSLYIYGVAQIVDVDFYIFNNSICWRNKKLDNIDLLPGDVFVIKYFI